jgi:hypothetical protein
MELDQKQKQEQLIEKACQAYRHKQLARIWLPAAPSMQLSRVEGDVVILKNSRGELARYRVIDGRLRWVEQEV